MYYRDAAISIMQDIMGNIEKWDKNTTSCIDLDFAFDESKSFGIWPFSVNYDTYYDLSKQPTESNI
jgi:hypothetical protein